MKQKSKLLDKHTKHNKYNKYKKVIPFKHTHTYTPKHKQKYTVKHTPKQSPKKSQKQLLTQTLPVRLNKYIQRILSQNLSSKYKNKDDVYFSFNPDNIQHNNKYNNKYIIASGLANIKNIITVEKISQFIWKYLPLDAELYIPRLKNANLKDKYKATGNNYKLEAYLYVSITDNNIFNAYMLDKLLIKKVLGDRGGVDVQSGVGDSNNTNKYFPSELPEFYPTDINQKFQYIFSVMNQCFTILKDISIIISKYVTRPNNIYNCFNIIKVGLHLDTQNNVMLDKCNIKTDWGNTYFENVLYNWLNKILIMPVLTNSKIPHIGLSTQLLYTVSMQNTKYTNYIDKYIENNIDITKMDINDFKDVYTIFITEKETDREFRISYLTNNLKKYALHPIDVYSSIGIRVKFLWTHNVEDNLDVAQFRKHYNTPAYLANSLSFLENFDNKFNLYNNMKRLFPNEYLNFMMESFPLTYGYKLKEGDILVAKPIYLLELLKQNKKFAAAQGIDIIFIDNNKTLNDAKQLLKKYDTVMINKYIMNPLLFQKHKFHFRLLFTITIINNTVKSYLLDIMRIITAKSPFKLKDYSNLDIHDTHLKTTPKDWYFPQDFTTENMGKEITPEIINKIWIDIREIIRKITIVALSGKDHIRLYKTNKNAFHTFGPDIMITEDFKPILLECNSNPTYKRINHNDHLLDQKLFDFMDHNILNPLFGYEKHKSKQSNHPTPYIPSMKDEPIFIQKDMTI